MADPKPSLETALLRLGWAEERLHGLEEALAAYRHSESVRVAGELEVNEAGDRNLTIRGMRGGTGPAIPFLTSEVLFHCRTALDYLVYELSALDSGTYQERTQFLIADTPERFKGDTRSYLKGVSAAHVAVFELLQPYHGTDWTRRLRDLSNRDKHRTVPPTGSRMNFAMGAPPNVPAGMVIPKMSVELKATTEIQLEKGVLLLDVLREIHEHSLRTLRLFEPFFA